MNGIQIDKRRGKQETEQAGHIWETKEKTKPNVLEDWWELVLKIHWFQITWVLKVTTDFGLYLSCEQRKPWKIFKYKNKMKKQNNKD